MGTIKDTLKQGHKILRNNMLKYIKFLSLRL